MTIWNTCKGVISRKVRNDHYQHLSMSICTFTRENILADKPTVRYEGKNSSYPQMLRKAEDIYWELH